MQQQQLGSLGTANPLRTTWQHGDGREADG